MDKYKEGILAALTEGENFEAIWEIYDLYPKRKNFVFHIAQVFVGNLEKSVLAAKRDRTLLTEKELSNDDVGVYIYSPKWRELICFGVEFSRKEEMWYSGIWFEKKELKAAADDLKIQAAKFLPDSDNFFTGTDWLRYKVLGNFDARDDVYRLLPPNLESTVEEYAADVWDMATKYCAEVDKWLDGVKKK